MPFKPSRIVDTHQHVYWHGRDDRGLVADLDEHGIDYAWLLTWEISPQEDAREYHSALNPVHLRGDGTHGGVPLRDLISCRDKHPDRFVLGYCPNPVLGDAPGLLRSAAKIHGAQVCGEWKFRVPFDDPRCLEIFHVAGELKLPVVLHLDVPYLPDKKGQRTYQPKWYGGTIDNLERAMEACRETIFIGHAPGFWREISADAPRRPEIYPQGKIKTRGRLWGLFDRNPNLRADLSAGSALTALRRDRINAVKFLTRYQDRLLFGRDYYGQDLHKFLQTLKVTGAVQEKIYWQNAEKLVTKPK